eukprot:TRINITY_DN3335_c0_g1_i2.p1 TRINITY_DN3335_c0_g1~~TRINITY_DN3335_c0_g1_i2.p1  ORF type:complete len:142 (-),score=22.91 TRINITY_DN3335_c0_g1_i2:71-496(-)
MWKDLMNQRYSAYRTNEDRSSYSYDTDVFTTYRKCFLRFRTYELGRRDPSFLRSNLCDWNCMIRLLPKKGCRFGVYRTGSNKFIFLLWATDDASLREKMLVASYMLRVRAELPTDLIIQGTEPHEIEFDRLKEKMNYFFFG